MFAIVRFIYDKDFLSLKSLISERADISYYLRYSYTNLDTRNRSKTLLSEFIVCVHLNLLHFTIIK